MNNNLRDYANTCVNKLKKEIETKDFGPLLESQANKIIVLLTSDNDDAIYRGTILAENLISSVRDFPSKKHI